MLLYFDQNSLNINIRLGALEEYSPTPGIIEVYEEAQRLKEKQQEFEKEFDPELDKLLAKIDRINLAANPQLKKMREASKKAKEQ